jgi:hypothetical protein
VITAKPKTALFPDVERKGTASGKIPEQKAGIQTALMREEGNGNRTICAELDLRKKYGNLKWCDWLTKRSLIL